MSPGVYAHYHQHIFNVRLDVAIDGERNRVVEVDTVALPVGPDNPHGNAFTIRENVLASELARAAQRRFQCGALLEDRERRARNGLGQPTAYKLLPLSPVPAFSSPQSSVARRAAFMTSNSGSRAYRSRRDARRPALSQPERAAATGCRPGPRPDRPLVDTDLVVWHSFGLHHIPRPEDFPVQPVTTSGFALHPAGFFDREPGARRAANRKQQELLRR